MSIRRDQFIMPFTIGIETTVYYKAVVKDQAYISTGLSSYINICGYSNTLYNGAARLTYNEAVDDLNNAVINNLRRL